MADKALLTACWTWADPSCGAAGVAGADAAPAAGAAFTWKAFSNSVALLACSFFPQPASSKKPSATMARCARRGFTTGQGAIEAGGIFIWLTDPDTDRKSTRLNFSHI